MENPRPLTLKDLAQATLTANDVLRAEDAVAYVLSQLQALPQIQFDNNSAQFIPTGEEGLKPITLFKEFVRRMQAQRYEIARMWSDSLFFDVQKTSLKPAMFAEFQADTPIPRAFEYRSLQYSGKVIVASRWLDDWALSIREDDEHFRVVILTTETLQPITASMLQDPRIAVIVPGALTDETLNAATAYLAWICMDEEYKRQSSQEADTIREWLANQKSTIMSNLLNTQLGQYRAGEIITRDNLGISLKDAFGAAGNEKRLSYIVEKLLASAYPQVPVETNALRSTLTPTEAGKVFEGYFSKDASAAQIAPTRTYGVGLGLSSSDQPSRLAPQETNVVLRRITEMLAARKGAELPIWQIFQTLSNPPYGLPYVVIQLYLFAFVRQNNPRVELTLKDNHRLRTRDDKAFTRNHITAATVSDIRWKSGLNTVLDVLLPAAGPTWSDALPYARVLLNDLRVTNDQQEIEAETLRLNDRLSALEADVPKQRNALAVLERTLAAELPNSSKQTLDKLEALGQVKDGYAAFYEAAQEVYKTPDALRDGLVEFDRLRELASFAAEIAEVKRYLEAVRLRESDNNLSMLRTSLLGRLNLSSLVAQPHTWNPLRADFEQFQARYRTEYQKHHRDVNKELVALTENLAGVPRQLNALGLVNRITQLGPARGEYLRRQYEQLIEQLQPCSITDYLQVSVDATPVCEKCGRDLRYAPPTDAGKQFLRNLEAALKQRQADLGTQWAA